MRAGNSAESILSQLKVCVLLLSGTTVDFLSLAQGEEVLVATAVAVNDSRIDLLLMKLAAHLDDLKNPAQIENIMSPALVRSPSGQYQLAA